VGFDFTWGVCSTRLSFFFSSISIDGKWQQEEGGLPPPNAPLLRNQMSVCSSLFKLGITNAPVIYVSSSVRLTYVCAGVSDQGLEYASNDYHMPDDTHGHIQQNV